MSRAVAVCDAKRPACPRCGLAIPWLTSALGSMWVTCRNRLPYHLARDRRRCGQHMFLTGAPEGLCIVLAVTREEFGKYAQRGLNARTLYHELGLLTDPLLAEVGRGEAPEEAD